MVDIHLLATTGNGPVECRIALASLLSILRGEAKARGCTFEATAARAPDAHGPASAVLTIGGDCAMMLANEYCGTIRFVFKSPVRPHHKRQNWFVGVRTIELAGDTADAVTIDPQDIRFETLRAGGPGGQHQNTTDSAVRATHVPTGITVICRDERSQHRNKATAIRRLQAALQLLAERDARNAKTALFLANKDLERGNEVKAFRL
ncbi:peptide chain release factor H [Pararhizobium sp. BT-229]|uniref:peptide chain release factor H n=1 Tax=Pararhizobium sp. BT-229 TaxID=2986923 RepID=UPI0021F6A5F4|nr:peptide chain release factor H [Pararhizobium sp. BT-229]MCV9961309.1 peptide chain release factor H [Pararhizobium sp. BT-229]